MSLHVRKDDTVMVIAGRESGKTGRILKILIDRNRALVEKLNLVKKHARPSKASPQGGIVQKEAGIHLSNLMVCCPKCSKPVRLGVQFLKDGKKVRVCKKCKEIVDKH